MMKKREAPGPVEPVHLDGIRYEAVPWGRARGLGQNGGFLAAVDDRTGEELWMLKVYDTPDDPRMEGDKQDVFVRHLGLDKNRRLIVVENERGERFVVDIDKRSAAAA